MEEGCYHRSREAAVRTGSSEGVLLLGDPPSTQHRLSPRAGKVGDMGKGQRQNLLSPHICRSPDMVSAHKEVHMHGQTKVPTCVYFAPLEHSAYFAQRGSRTPGQERAYRA